MENLVKRQNRTTIIELFGVRSISDQDGIFNAILSGADVNQVDSGGRTILMESVVSRDATLTERLLSVGADPNIKDLMGWTALHFCAQAGDVRIAELLVNAGADVNAADRYGNNVIWRAVFDYRTDRTLVDYLLKSGANPSEQNQSGISAMDIAATEPLLELNPTG